MGFSSLLGPQKSSHVDICQQAGCKRLDVCSRDISASQSHFHQGSPLAYTRLLRFDGRGVSHTSPDPGLRTNLKFKLSKVGKKKIYP